MMHLTAPYLTTTKSNRRKKASNSKRLKKATTEHELWLKSMGVGKTKPDAGNKIPDYKTKRMTSDKVAANGTMKEQVKYTGDEIAGIVTTHKSNLMPIRKDNKQAAIDAANMRR